MKTKEREFDYFVASWCGTSVHHDKGKTIKEEQRKIENFRQMFKGNNSYDDYHAILIMDTKTGYSKSMMIKHFMQEHAETFEI